MRGCERAKWAQTQKEGLSNRLLRGCGTGVCGMVWQPQQAVHRVWEGRASVTRAPVKVGARTDQEAFATRESRGIEHIPVARVNTH